MFKLFLKKICNKFFLCLSAKVPSNRRKISKEDFNRELIKGIEIEMKYTKNNAVAKDMALDNLYENPDYYNKY